MKMSVPKTLWTLVLLCSVGFQTVSADPILSPLLKVKAQLQGVVFDDSKQLTIRFWLQELMLSALYRDVIEKSSATNWQRDLSSESTIHCQYRSEQTIALPERPTLRFDEVLFSLPAKGYPEILLRNGEQVLALSKYDPWVLHKLVSESGLSMEPDLSSVPRGLF